MLDKKAARELAMQYAEEVKKVLEPSAIIIFGSYVNGVPNEYSDIDIAVLVKDYQDDWLKASSLLCGLTRRVSIDIEPHLLDETKDSSGFIEHIKKTGEYIYTV